MTPWSHSPRPGGLWAGGGAGQDGGGAGGGGADGEEPYGDAGAISGPPSPCRAPYASRYCTGGSRPPPLPPRFLKWTRPRPLVMTGALAQGARMREEREAVLVLRQSAAAVGDDDESDVYEAKQARPPTPPSAPPLLSGAPRSLPPCRLRPLIGRGTLNPSPPPPNPRATSTARWSSSRRTWRSSSIAAARSPRSAPRSTPRPRPTPRPPPPPRTPQRGLPPPPY